eukprot:1377252-Amorphochlora_amoeboformis.AAC.2
MVLGLSILILIVTLILALNLNLARLGERLYLSLSLTKPKLPKPNAKPTAKPNNCRPLQRIVKSLVEEKETKIKELMFQVNYNAKHIT